MNLHERASQAHANAAAEKLQQDLLAFQKLLKEKFATDHVPTSLTTEIEDVKVTYLNPEELYALRKCDKCPREFPTDGVKDLQQLGAELARPVPGHACAIPIAKNNTAQAPARKAAKR